MDDQNEACPLTEIVLNHDTGEASMTVPIPPSQATAAPEYDECGCPMCCCEAGPMSLTITMPMLQPLPQSARR